MALSAAPCAASDDFPADERPENIELLYYAYHVMVGLGTLLLALAFFFAAVQAWRRRITESRVLLWILMLTAPLPYIANTAGWITAEVGRQPWLIYGLLRTERGHVSQRSTAGDTIFTPARILRPLPRGRAHLSLSLRARGRTRSDATRVDAGGGGVMVILWYADRLRRMLAIYVVLDGFDLGARVRSIVCSRRREASDRRSSPRPGRGCGTATRYGSSPVVARCSARSQPPTQRASPASTCRSCSCSGCSSAAVSAMELRQPHTATRCGVNSGTRSSSSRACS